MLTDNLISQTDTAPLKLHPCSLPHLNIIISIDVTLFTRFWEATAQYCSLIMAAPAYYINVLLRDKQYATLSLFHAILSLSAPTQHVVQAHGL